MVAPGHKTNLSALTISAPEPSGDMYVGVADVQRNKAQQKKEKELKEQGEVMI